MEEKKVYTEGEIEALAKKAGQEALDNFHAGLSCSESVLLPILKLGVSDFSTDVCALSAGFGGGMGKKGYACGAVTGGLMGICSVYGRKNPYRLSTTEERLAEQHEGEKCIASRANRYMTCCENDMKHINCGDVRGNYNFDPNDAEAYKKCEAMVVYCAEQATREALKD